MKITEFTSQYGDKMISVVIENTEYSIDLGFTREEQKEDFFFDFGTSCDSEKAFKALTAYQDGK